MHSEKNYISFLLAYMKDRYKYILIIWVSILCLYLILGGNVHMSNKLTMMTGVVFSIIMLFPGKYYNRVFFSILLSGCLFSYITPVMDIPDENHHYARALYLADGHLYVPNRIEESIVADDIEDVENSFKKPLSLSNLEKERVTESKVVYAGLTRTNGYSFVSYLPQTLGILIARLFNFTISTSIILGRILNVLVYALLVRLAMKKSNSQQYILGTISLLPMSVYLASSFNQDAIANGVVFLLIGIFCEYLEKDKITYVDIFLFSMLSLLLATMKFPYILIIGLLLFLPSEKLTIKKYFFIISLILSIMLLSLAWLRLSSSINLQIVSVNQGINPVEKLSYTLQNIGSFIVILLKELIYLIPTELQGMFTFGWLTYVLDFSWLYMLYMFAVFIIVPRKKIFSNLNKLGVTLVSLAIILGILLTAYLMWNPVGDMSFTGVQGRYFIGVFTLLGLIFNIFDTDSLPGKFNIRKTENVLILCSNWFVLALILRTLVEYYQF